MAIPVTPLRIAADAFEVELPRESRVLPEMILRLDGPDLAPLYAEVLEVCVAGDGLQVGMSVLHGQPSLLFNQARLMKPSALAQELQKLTGELEQSVTLSDDLCVDGMKLGTLTAVAGEPFEARFEAFVCLLDGLAQHRKVLLLDPLGLFEDGEGVMVLRAGEDIRLSIQCVGLSRFLSAVSETLPDPVQADALQILMRHAPISPDFTPFKRFLNLDKADDTPVKSALLYNLYEIYGQQVFADQPEEVLDTGALETPLTVLDLSALSEPWKSLFYEEVLKDWLADTGSEILPGLIYPEHHLDSLSDWIPRVEAQGANVVALVSPYEGESLPALADNWLEVKDDAQLEVRGLLTAEIPVRIPLSSVRDAAAERVPMAAGPLAAAEEFQAFPDESEPFSFDMPDSVDVAASSDEATGALTWQDLGWEGTAQQPADTPKSAETPATSALPDASPLPSQEYDDEEVPMYDSILGDMRELDQNRPVLTSEDPPGPAPMYEMEAAMSSLASETEDELDFSFSWDGDDEDPSDSTPQPQVEPNAPDAKDDFQFEDTFSLGDVLDPPTAASAPSEAAVPADDLYLDDVSVEDASDAPNFQDDIPVYATRGLEAQPLSGDDFSVGDRVRHPKHGVGIIQKKIPMDQSVILNIQFEELGKCLVDPKLAPLEKV